IDSFFIFIVLRLCPAFDQAGLLAASLPKFSENMDRKCVRVAIALYISSNALGGMVGRVLTGYITDHYSWEIAFYFLGVMGLIILVMVFFSLPKSRFFQSSNETFMKEDRKSVV